MKSILHILVFMCQLIGAVLVGIGLKMIFDPLGWIYAGAATFYFGHLLYLVAESEDVKT